MLVLQWNLLVGSPSKLMQTQGSNMMNKISLHFDGTFLLRRLTRQRWMVGSSMTLAKGLVLWFLRHQEWAWPPAGMMLCWQQRCLWLFSSPVDQEALQLIGWENDSINYHMNMWDTLPMCLQTLAAPLAARCIMGKQESLWLFPPPIDMQGFDK